MKRQSVHITIPQPCHESWDKMDATKRGAFCQSCQKEVIDFSAMTDREVIEYLAKNKTECGQFREDQLDRDLVMHKIKNGFLKWRAIALGLLTVVSFKNVFASRIRPHTAQISQTTFAANNTKPTPDTITISGHVKNEKGEPFAGVYIALVDRIDGDKTDHYAETDSQGYFKMIIDKKAKIMPYLHPPFHLEFCSLLYHTKKIHVSNKREQQVDVTLHKHHHRLMKGRLSMCQ